MMAPANWALAITASLASSGLVVGLAFGLGASQSEARVPGERLAELDVSRLEALLEEVLERLDRRPIAPAIAPSTQHSPRTALSRRALNANPVESSLSSALVELRRSIDELGTSDEFEPAVLIRSSRALNHEAMNSLRRSHGGEDGVQRFVEEYRLRSVSTLLERFGRPTDLHPEGWASSSWSWSLSGEVEFSASVVDGVITDLELWAN